MLQQSLQNPRRQSFQQLMKTTTPSSINRDTYKPQTKYTLLAVHPRMSHQVTMPQRRTKAGPRVSIA